MITYEVTFRFRTPAEVPPRVEITADQVAQRIAPYIFPKGSDRVVYLGSALTRLDDYDTRELSK